VTLDEVKRVAVKYLTEPVVAVVSPGVDQMDLGIKPVEILREQPVRPNRGGP